MRLKGDISVDHFLIDFKISEIFLEIRYVMFFFLLQIIKKKCEDLISGLFARFHSGNINGKDAPLLQQVVQAVRK